MPEGERESKPKLLMMVDVAGSVLCEDAVGGAKVVVATQAVCAVVLGTVEVDGEESGITEVASVADLVCDGKTIGLGDVGLDLAKFEAKLSVFVDRAEGDSAGEGITRSRAGEE